MSRDGKAVADHHWIVLALSMGLSGFLAVLSGQDAGFDLLNYHYYQGFALFHKNFGYDFAPAQIQSFHNPLIDALSYLALANFPARLAAAFLGAVQGLNFYLVFRICLLLFSRIRTDFRYLLAFLCAGSGFYGIVSSTELGVTYGDSLVSILVLSGVLLILRRLDSESLSVGKTSLLIFAAGLLFGAAFGLKSTTIIYAIAVALSFPLALPKKRDCIRMTAALWIGIMVGGIAAYGYWGIKLYNSYGNPVFPYMNEIFRSRYFDPVNFLDDRFMPRNWQQTLFYPFFFIQRNSLVSEIEFRDIRVALCYAAVILIAGFSLVRLFRSRDQRAAPDPRFSFLTLFLLVSYVAWLYFSSIYRYLSVLELLAPAFLVYSISRFVTKESAIAGSAALLSLAILISAVPIDFGRQLFDNELLKLRIPEIRELDKSVVLMAGYEPTSYVIPSFPAGTRFVRVSSTYTAPGRNSFVDGEIKRILSGYDARHTFAFVPNESEIGMARLDASAYNIAIDSHSCFEIRSRGRNRGYLCGVRGAPPETNEKPLPDLRYSPKVVKSGGVLFSGHAEKKYIHARIDGLRADSVDILYELEGEMMPPIRNWSLEPPGRLHLGPFGRVGHYRIVGLRDARGADPHSWIALDAAFDLR